MTAARHTPTLGYDTLSEPLRQRAERDPKFPLLTLLHEDGRREVIDADTFYREALGAAATLQANGVGPGDVVVFLLGHVRSLFTGFIGALCYGAIPSVFPIYLDPRSDLSSFGWRIAAMLGAIEPRCLVTFPSHVADIADLIGARPCRVLDADALRSTDRADPPAPRPPGPDDRAFLQFTSGSGGMPKGILPRHRAVLSHIGAKRLGTGFGDHEVTVGWLPMYHDLGLISALLTPFVLGHPVVLISPAHWVRSPHVLLRALHDYRGTITGMPNFGFSHSVRAIRDRDLEGIDLSCVRTFACGGEPARLDTIRRFNQRFAPFGYRETALRCGYGAAELLEAATTTTPGAVPTVEWVDRDVLQCAQYAQPIAPEQPTAMSIVSAGTPLPGTEVRIASTDGTPVGERHVGDILVRSPYMFDGYYRQPELTQAALRGGFFHTGDIGYMANGELFVTGRKSDLMIVGGRNVHPEDVETVVDRVAGLRPGRSVAFGIADDALGTERVVIVCEPVDDAAAGSPERRQLDQRVRQEVKRALDLAVGEVRFAARGWVVKTSSGKTARGANRDKYLQEWGAERSRRGDGRSG